MKRIIVCVKPVPDPKHWNRVSLDPATKTLRREGIPIIINPFDKNALELALSIQETKGSEVVILSMAPDFATPAIKEGLAMGADRAVLLSDPLFAGSDTLATAIILAAGCRWIGEFDLILCGNSTIDGSTAQVPSQLAEFLDIPNVMHVIGLEWRDRNRIIITQKIEQGHARLEGTFPILLSVRKELNKPRYIPFTGILEAESKEISIMSNKDFSIAPSLLGLDGSPTKMADLEVRHFERAGERLEGSVEDLVRELADRMHQFGVF